jgi:hypothetical protein
MAVYQTTQRVIPEVKLQIDFSMTAEHCDPSATDR